MAAATARRQLELPIHDYAEDHKLLLAQKQYGNRRRLKKVEDLPASGITAFNRLREFAYDLGHELGMERGWMVKVATRMGLNYKTLWNIVHGVVTMVDTTTVDTVARASGVPVAVFYDAEI